MLILQTEIIQLSFLTDVHFGKKRLSDAENSIQADTLFSALFIEALHNGMDTDFLLNDIILSDTFPYKGATFYLPKPFIQVAPKDEKNFKAIKQLNYLPYEKMQDYFDGKISSDVAEEISNKMQLGNSTVYTKGSIPRNRAGEDKEDNQVELYTVGTYSFNQDAGLYFFVRGNEAAIQKLYQVLDSLQYAGLGGKRSSGYGRFSYETVDNQSLRDFIENTGKRHILLSSAMKKPEETFKLTEDDYYTVQKRSGFIQSNAYAKTLRKKRDFYTFQAGSVFKEKFDGDIFNVQDRLGKHPVYRYAKAFWLEV